MDLKKATYIKTAIAYSFLKPQRQQRRTISFSSSIASATTSNIQAGLQSTINGVGIGEKTNGESFIKVLVKTKTDVSPAKLSKHYGIDSRDIIIEETGPIKFKMADARTRPPYPGLSIGHYKVTAGTLGCFVKDERNKIYILSNNHVIANTNKGVYRDPILQPGKLDGGKKARDKIAELTHLVELNYSKSNSMDASIAEVTEDLGPIFLLNNKNKISGTALPRNKMKVEKFGRTTGHTKGKITTRNLDMKIDFDGTEIEFEDQFEIKGNGGKMFCDGGDSGSLVFESETLHAVGLLFAGTEDGTTFATPIKNVLYEFSVKIL